MNKLFLLMNKQYNRGQQGAGIACVKLEANPGEDYMFRERAEGSGAISEIFAAAEKKYANSPGEHQLYIIDEVHMLSLSAFNALLKTLEEPPAYVIIILITSNKNSLLDTIKSRCEIIKFLPVSFIQTKKYLEDMGICQQFAIINREKIADIILQKMFSKSLSVMIIFSCFT